MKTTWTWIGELGEVEAGLRELADELKLKIELGGEGKAGGAEAIGRGEGKAGAEAIGRGENMAGGAEAIGRSEAADDQAAREAGGHSRGDGTTEAERAVTVRVERGGEGLAAGYADGRAWIRYESKHQFFRAFSLLLEKGVDGPAWELAEQQRIGTVGPMFDLSRNGVLTLDAWRSLLRRMALMGLNSVMLYMEDTYEIPGEPYFGYMRGRYSAEELRAIDDYADLFGIEAFPSIQTLAHLEEFLKWEPVKGYKDTKGALLAQDDRVLELVERMIERATVPFRSRKIHIGMDEAEEVGRGKHLDLHGFDGCFPIIAGHLQAVLDIVRRRGLSPMMWSDMFLKLASANGAEHFDRNTVIPEEMARQIPSDVDMVYWDYNHFEPEHYEAQLGKHRPLGCRVVFAGGVWVFNTFGVNYGLSLAATEAALLACKAEGVDEVYATMWGDDGMESNPFIALLGLQYYAEQAYCDGRPEWSRVEARTLACTGTEAAAFLLLNGLDETPGAEPGNRKQTNPSKFLLYQDVLLGLFDRQIAGLELDAHYAELEAEIAASRRPGAALDPLFEVPERLCGVLRWKSQAGLRLKAAYDADDRAELERLASELLPRIAEAVRALREAHRRQWLSMFKPFGWEVLDIRYGGVLTRLDTAALRLRDYLDGRAARLEELEQERLPYSTVNLEQGGSLGWCSYYYRMASPNVFYHVQNPF